MKNKIFIIMVFFEFNLNACSIQLCSNKDSIRNVIINETTDFINQIEKEDTKRRVWVLKIIKLDTSASDCIFSISYIYNKLDLRSLHVSRYFKINSEIVLVDVNQQDESNVLLFSKIDSVITAEFSKKLRSFWDENDGALLYTSDYRIVFYHNGVKEIKNMLETSVPDTLKVETDSAIRGYNNFMKKVKHYDLNDSTMYDDMPDFLKNK